MARRSFWAWGMEDQEPSHEQYAAMAERLFQRYGATLDLPTPPTDTDLRLRKPRLSAHPLVADICTSDDHDRAAHTYGRSFRDRVRGFNRQFPNPPDVIAYPRTEDEVRTVLDWCSNSNIVAIPYGGGSTVVAGVEPPEADAVVTIDLAHLDQVLEVDETSRAARIQAGVLGPALEAQLRPSGHTLRHFPQSFEFSSLGGWIATRSGGHYATNHTHIDDFVESVRMVTPAGLWESRRLPGSGAGPSPDRMVIGSEGILGIITEAWMRIQARPRYRGSAGVAFSSMEGASEGARLIAQAKLWPANLRMLDPAEAQDFAGFDGVRALLIIGFESAELPQGDNIRQAVAIARDAGGIIDEDAIMIADAAQRSDASAGRQGAVGSWRNSFINAPYERNATIGFGVVAETLETSITWERWPALDAAIRSALHDALQRTCGNGRVSCRFTHVYPDGPAPYYTFEGLGKVGGELEAHAEIKQAASDAVLAAGGTITHHHAVGRSHRPWYDAQRPDPFAEALRAAKRVLDPHGILNPGVLIDP